MKIFLFTILSFITGLVCAQSTKQFSGEEKAVQDVVKMLFDGMRKGDSSMVSKTFHPSARLQTTFTNKEGKAMLMSEEVGEFLKAVGTPHEVVYDERILSYDIKVDDNLATVWTPYEFYAGEQFSHCGVNAFQLYKSENGWKIIQITDTRRKKGCK